VRDDAAASIGQKGGGVTEHRPGSGGTEDNVRDEWDESQEKHHRDPKKDATKEAVEEEEASGAPGGVKSNVRDEWDESQRR
jgi:hypothetical protein